MGMMRTLENAAQFLIIIASAPLAAGIINKLKAWFTGRKGAGVLQPYYDLARILKKETINAGHASFISRLSPVINLVAVLIAAAMIPLGAVKPLISFNGDIILFAYILSFARFFQIMAAMDIGNSFEGMGASREATFAVFVEPIFFFTAGSIAFLSGMTSLYDIFNALNTGSPAYLVFISVCSVSFFILAVTECSRMPVDDPNTHLELTMIHEVMILDNSGTDLFFYQYSSYLKLALYMFFNAAFFYPLGRGWFLFTPVAALLFITAVALVETAASRIKLKEIPQYLLFAATIGILNVLIITYYR